MGRECSARHPLKQSTHLLRYKNKQDRIYIYIYIYVYNIYINICINIYIFFFLFFTHGLFPLKGVATNEKKTQSLHHSHIRCYPWVNPQHNGLPQPATQPLHIIMLGTHQQLVKPPYRYCAIHSYLAR